MKYVLPIFIVLAILATAMWLFVAWAIFFHPLGI